MKNLNRKLILLLLILMLVISFTQPSLASTNKVPALSYRVSFAKVGETFLCTQDCKIRPFPLSSGGRGQFIFERISRLDNDYIYHVYLSCNSWAKGIFIARSTAMIDGNKFTIEFRHPSVLKIDDEYVEVLYKLEGSIRGKNQEIVGNYKGGFDGTPDLPLVLTSGTFRARSGKAKGGIPVCELTTTPTEINKVPKDRYE